jgi:hypothetical protein
MIQPVPFGRRDTARAQKPAALDALRAPALTPQQRALLFGAGEETCPESAPAPSRGIAPWSPRAALAASLAVAGLVAALTLAGESREPVALAVSALSLAANLAGNLWLTQKIGALARQPGLAAFALTGALLGLGLSFAAARLGLGHTELGYEMDALSGAGAALLYRLLAGGPKASPFS